MMQAAMMYSNDWKQSLLPVAKLTGAFNDYPSAADNAVMGTGYRWAYWATAMDEYLTSRKTFECPLGSTRQLGSQILRVQWGYGISPFVLPVDNIGARTSAIPLKLEAFRNPHQKIYIADSGFSTMSHIAGTSPRTYFAAYFSTTFDTSTDNRVSPAIRHNQRGQVAPTDNALPNFDCGFNAGYMDGHGAYTDWRTAVPNGYNTNVRRTYWSP
jgi:hypothetical protein